MPFELDHDAKSWSLKTHLERPDMDDHTFWLLKCEEQAMKQLFLNLSKQIIQLRKIRDNKLRKVKEEYESEHENITKMQGKLEQRLHMIQKLMDQSQALPAADVQEDAQQAAPNHAADVQAVTKQEDAQQAAPNHAADVQEAAKQEATKKEAANQAVAKQEAAKKEAAKQAVADENGTQVTEGASRRRTARAPPRTDRGDRARPTCDNNNCKKEAGWDPNASEYGPFCHDCYQSNRTKSRRTCETCNGPCGGGHTKCRSCTMEEKKESIQCPNYSEPGKMCEGFLGIVGWDDNGRPIRFKLCSQCAATENECKNVHICFGKRTRHSKLCKLCQEMDRMKKLKGK